MGGGKLVVGLIGLGLRGLGLVELGAIGVFFTGAEAGEATNFAVMASTAAWLAETLKGLGLVALPDACVPIWLGIAEFTEKSTDVSVKWSLLAIFLLACGLLDALLGVLEVWASEAACACT